MRRKLSRVFLLVTVMLLSFTFTAQAEYPVVEWVRQLGTTSDDEGRGVAVDASGNAYVTGSTKSGLDGNNSEGNADMFLSKYDTNGVKLWTQQLGTATTDYGYGVSVDSSGNAYVTGYTLGSIDSNISAGRADMFLTKYNTNGVKLWTRQLGTADSDCGKDVSVDVSGNAYVTGYTSGSFDGYTCVGRTDIFLAKHDTAGNLLWIQQLGTADYDWAESVSVDGSGNAYVAGTSKDGLDGNTYAGGCDIFLSKYDTDGAKQWTRQLGTSQYDRGNGVSVDGSGNAYVTGYTWGDLDGNTGAGCHDMFLTKYDTDGNKLWTKQLGTTSDDYGLGVSVDSSDNVYVTGCTEGNLDGNTSAGGPDIFLTKYDTDGTKLWTKQLGTADCDIGAGVSVDSSGNAYVTGYTGYSSDFSEDNPDVGDWDLFLVKISTVPEPGSLAMLAGIALAMIVFRLRRHKRVAVC